MQAWINGAPDEDRARSGVQNLLSYAPDFLGVLSLPCKNPKKH